MEDTPRKGKEQSSKQSSEQSSEQSSGRNSEQSSELITTLSARTQRFIHLYLTGQYTLSKLSQLLEVHPNTISRWLKDENVKFIINDLQKETHDIVGVQLKALTLKAVNKLNSLIDSPFDGVALQAVKDVLDRSGHKAKQEIKVDKTITIEEQMRQLVNETILDAEYELIEDESDG